MKWLTAGLLLLAAAPAARAQDGADALVLLQQTLPASVWGELHGALAGAAAAGLPVASVAERLLEAEAKGSPPDQLPPLARRITAQLVVGRAALNEAGVAAPGRDEIEAAAAAVSRGATAGQVMDVVRATRSSGPVTVALFTLAELRDAGRPLEHAAPIPARLKPGRPAPPTPRKLRPQRP